MKENEDVAINRNNKNNKNAFLPKIIGFCVLLLILVMVLGAVFSALTGDTLSDIGNKKSDGMLIYDSLPDSIRNIEDFSSGVVMLTDTAVDYLDSDGKRIASNSHLFSQPVMLNNESTVFLYDKGGSAYRIEKGTSVYNSFDVNGTIITACLGKKDNYAYVLNDDSGFQSHLFIYSKKGNKQFEWGSTSDYCMTVALSDNGKSAAVAMISVADGIYISKVHFFNFNSGEAVYTSEFTDCTVFGLEFINNKEIAVWTDSGIYRIDKEGTAEILAEYQSSEIRHSSSFSGGLKSVATARHGNDNNSKVSVFDKKFKELFSLDFSSSVNRVDSNKKYSVVVLDDSVEVYDYKNRLVSTVILGERCIDIALSGTHLYAHSVSGIYVFSIGESYDLPAAAAEEENTTESGFSDDVTFENDENGNEITSEPVTPDDTSEETMISYG